MLDEKRNALTAIQARVKDKDSLLAPLMSELLNKFDAELWTQARRHLGYELNGFTNSAEYYEKPGTEERNGGYIPERTMYFRAKTGNLAVVHADGRRTKVIDEIGRRGIYFVDAPIAHLQEQAALSDVEVELQMPELTRMIGEKEGGRITLICERSEVQRMVDIMRRGLETIIHIMLNPDELNKMDELSRLKKERESSANKGL